MDINNPFFKVHLPSLEIEKKIFNSELLFESTKNKNRSPIKRPSNAVTNYK